MNINNKIWLDKCEPKRCKQCDIGTLIVSFLKPIMQTLTNDIKDYNMRMLLTKCLNTSIVLSFILLGPIGVKRASYCDTQRTIDRHKKGIDNNREILDRLKLDLLNKNEPGRWVYYMLITDAYFPYDNVNRKDAFMPGHVVLIERINDGKEVFYYLYQSYINQYDFKGHFDRSKGTLRKSWDEIRNILEKVDAMLMAKKWNENTIQFWKDFTFVNTRDMKNSNSEERMYLCWRKTQATECVKYLEDYVNQKLRQLEKIPRTLDDKIYGDESKYDPRQNPMTNGEIRICLTNLLAQINLNRNNL